MKHSIMAYAVSLAGILAVDSTHAQSPPSLAATLESVRAQLARQGLIAYQSVTHDSNTNQTWTSQFTVQATNVTADAEACQVHFHWHTTVNGKQSADIDAGFDLHAASDVTMISMAEDMTDGAIGAGHPTWGISVQPQIWVVRVEREDGSRNALDFRDRATAQAVVKTLKQAMELCQ